MAKAANPNELRLVRIFDAPAKLVWESWTQDEHVKQWWGPRGFTLTTKSKDVRVGGQWIYTMHGPDGVDYPNITTYHVVEPYSRLVYDHGASEGREALFRVDVRFKEVENKTHMDMTMSLASAEAAKEIRKFIIKAGGDSTWDRFAEYLEEQQKRSDVFIINRSFETDKNTLFSMWLNPEHFAKWIGPTDTVTNFLSVDPREGGTSHYVMTDASGDKNYWKINYLTIKAPDLLVYSQSFCDEKGELAKPSFENSWPNTILTTVIFHVEGPQETRITLRWEVMGEATDQERQTFHNAKPGMTQGWTSSFDKLEALI